MPANYTVIAERRVAVLDVPPCDTDRVVALLKLEGYFASVRNAPNGLLFVEAVRGEHVVESVPMPAPAKD
jgi:hypothetical protein